MQRTETKFILNQKNIDIFFKQNNLYKTFPKRKIFSIYFDTDNFKDFYDSEEGTVPRKKIRFRTYDMIEINKNKFIEGQIEIKNTLPETRKKKIIKVKNKLQNIYSLIGDFFNKPRHPKIIVSYERCYFINNDNDRFTLDQNIKYQLYNNSHKFNPLYNEENNILEFKSEKTIYNDNTTFDFLEAYKVRFSKYCEGIKKVYSL
tara:strand:+ start:1788 stop:2396 length:609 start_codon:yes stop_codon:yes gene_type:complete